MRSCLALAVILGVAFVGCGKTRNLRGSFTKSADGKTYLAVADDNGGKCGQIRVDGTLWTHRIGEAAVIAPGPHRIACGGEITFDVPSGVVYRFDYWGP